MAEPTKSTASQPVVSQPAQPVQMDTATLLKMIEELKKPYVDPKIVEAKERQRLALREERKRSEENRKAREAACSHLREDNTSRIAWMQNSDLVTRGVCQSCNALFQPGHPDYMRLIKIPVGRAGIIS